MNLPPYRTYPQISNDRIILREIATSDLIHLIDISYYNGVKATNEKEALIMLKKIDANYREGDSIHWAIVDRVTDQIVGTCGYYRGFDSSAGELGCVLLPQFYGKGYMTEALRLAIEFGQQTIQLNRIWAATSTNNHKAQKLLTRLGFVDLKSEGDEITYELQ